MLNLAHSTRMFGSPWFLESSAPITTIVLSPLEIVAIGVVPSSPSTVVISLQFPSLSIIT